MDPFFGPYLFFFAGAVFFPPTTALFAGERLGAMLLDFTLSHCGKRDIDIIQVACGMVVWPGATKGAQKNWLLVAFVKLGMK